MWCQYGTIRGKNQSPASSGGGAKHPTNQDTDLFECLVGRHLALGVVPVGHAVALAEQGQGDHLGADRGVVIDVVAHQVLDGVAVAGLAAAEGLTARV